MPYYVYIITNKCNGTLYIGFTNDIARRIHEHRNKAVQGFAAKYSLTRLVYFEVYEDIAQAQQREKTLKHWLRDWKLVLIERHNPDWVDLSATLMP